MSKSVTALLVAIWLVLCGVLYYWMTPELSIFYVQGYFYIFICMCIFSCFMVLRFSSLKSFMIFLLVAVGITLIGVLIGSPIFNSTKMYNQIGKFEERSFKEDVLEIDTSQIPTVDIDLATRVADKKLGEEIALGSQVKVGKFTNKQQVNGKLVYVAPLEHRGFFKWFSNKWGTPGYVIVSATNPNDVKLVREVNGNPLKLKYMPSAWFSSELERYVRFSGYRTKGLAEPSFELDDEGNPYWVITTYENAVFLNCPEATGVVICNPQTGEINWYHVSEVPEWVDIVQPEKFIKTQLANYGKYVHGWFNPSDRDKLSVTEHITTVYNDGDCFYYTGMSSSGADEGTVGFVLVNTRDKSVVYYKMVGATEEAAMRSAEGKVQHMGYMATNPIPLNISGIPAYFCTLKDDEGLVKAYAMLKIEDYSVVATGSTIMETKRSFINAVNASGSRVDFGSGQDVYGYEAEGIVSRIGYNIENGETYYYMILDDDASKLYLASYAISEELPITREGDTVKITYVDESNGAINIITFDNVKFAQTTSTAQEELNKEQEENNIINSDDTTVTAVDPEKQQKQWDDLTDEEKATLLKQLDDD